MVSLNTPMNWAKSDELHLGNIPVTGATGGGMVIEKTWSNQEVKVSHGVGFPLISYEVVENDHTVILNFKVDTERLKDINKIPPELYSARRNGEVIYLDFVIEVVVMVGDQHLIGKVYFSVMYERGQAPSHLFD